MKREELIIAKAGDLSDFAINHGYPASYANGYYEGFQEGAEWADENPRKGLVDVEKACDAFCKVRCKGKPPRSTCTSLGTCREHDDFKKTMRGE